VRNWATIIACYHATAFLGEPHNAAFKAEFDTAVEMLKAIQRKEADIPGVTITSDKGGVPTVSIMTVDVMRNPSMRVNLPASTGRSQTYPLARDLPTSYPRRPV
jgi:hypothetical protein